MDSNSQLKKAYKALTEKVVYGVNASSIMDFLFAAEVLTDADYRDLCHDPDGPQKTRSLLAILHTAVHPAAFTTLHEAIKRQAAHGFLANEIDNYCTQLTEVTSAAAKPEQKGKITNK